MSGWAEAKRGIWGLGHGFHERFNVGSAGRCRSGLARGGSFQTSACESPVNSCGRNMH